MRKNKLTKIQLEEILRDWNFWDRNLTEKETGWIRGEYTENIAKHMKSREVIVLKGARRSGKSTLMYQLMKRILDEGATKQQLFYLNLEDFKLSNYLTVDLLEQSLSLYREIQNPEDLTYCFLDEIQNVPKWEKWIRTHYDKRSKIKFIISGSSSSLLSRELSTLLTGRNLSFTIYPFGFGEYLRTQNIEIKPARIFKDFYFANKKRKALIKKNFNSFLKFGGFPEIIKKKDEDKKEDLLSQYFEDIIYKDVAYRHKLREVKNAFDIAVYALSNTGCKFSINNTAKVLKISPNTVSDIVGFLESAYLLIAAKQFSYSLKTVFNRQKPVKIYGLDNGFIRIASPGFSRDLGALYENLFAQYLNRKGEDLYYWQGKREVDFVLKQGGKKVVPVNVTFDDNIRDREKEGIIEFCREFKQKEGIIITDNLFEEEKNNGVTIKYYPLYLYLLYPLSNC